ncbi:DNA excision repair protein ERCC-6-like 2, partial [Lecanoromycetidae sp. Uapishka_2]
MDDFMDMTSSDDDLDIVKAVKKDLGHEDYIEKVVGTVVGSEAESLDSHEPLHRVNNHGVHPSGEKVDFSDDDSEEAYKTFKNRKSVKRKKAAASTRKAKAVEKGNVVGKRQKKTKLESKGRGKGNAKQWGEESDDDQLMEYTLPDYLQNRRARFDKRTEKLQAAGLKLPPRYDDIEFSDDERLQDLVERPDFPKGKPMAAYKDKQLPKSLGLIPAPITQWLRDYQVEGTAFLHTLFVYQTGGILGDDMGLGKTVQVISFLTAAFGKTADERDAKRMRKMRRADAPWYPKALVNSYDELWTLLNWTNPGKFGPISTWKQSISLPLKMGQSHDATVYQLSKARKTAKALVENLLPQFFLRRMKTLIADQLPRKSDRVVFCPLTETQADAYENCIDSDVFLPDGGKWQSYVFPAIAHLQKLANHLAILIPNSDDSKDKQSKDLEMLQVAVPDQWRDLYRTRDSIVNYSNPEFCGKWRILKKLLRFWHGNGDKVLVFSHSVRLLKMLRMLFQHTTYNVSYLDGAMSYLDRAKTVDDFNSDPDQFVFLISTKAGGVGLNITSANKVVVVDPNWNPAYDLQAQDRAYRIGQVRDVEVFRLVSAGTIEEIVYARQIYKQQQANIGYTASTERRYFKGVQENKDQKGEIFGLANLFSFQTEKMVLRDIVNKTNVAESKAGVTIVGVDLDNPADNKEGDDPFLDDSDDKDENSAMSQLAALIVDEAEEAAGKAKKRKISGSQKKSDPVQAILANAGVEYTHENSEVVGSSKIEASLSRRAQEAGNDFDMGGQHVFANTQDQVPIKRRDPGNNAESDSEDSKVEWRYHPPQDVMKRQLCTMARTFGFADAVEFALVVEGWTQAQRRSCLERFYAGRRKELGLDGKEERERKEVPLAERE